MTNICSPDKSKYRILFISDFNVNSTGHIILISTLPRDVTKHIIVVKVGDSDKPTDPDFTTTTTVTVYVNSE